MQKIPVERARELYNQERDKIITTTEKEFLDNVA
jgi:hypothetical protein